MRSPTKRGLKVSVALAAGLLVSSAGGSVAQSGSPLTSGPAVPQHSNETAIRAEPLNPPLKPLPDPDSFARRIDNPYMPWLKGSRWVYVEHTPEGAERIVVKVLDRTKRIAGIRATVVRDIVRLDGELLEDTFDWYAQDQHRNVWYLGEATKSYEDGGVSTEGSWQHGVDGAKAGIAMPGCPHVGKLYWQEYYPGHAEDQGRVLDKSARVAGPTGDYKQVILTEDITPLDRQIQEYKFYAPGVGVVLELNVSPEPGRGELVRFSRPGR